MSRPSRPRGSDAAPGSPPPGLPDLRAVPTLTEVVDWPPAEAEARAEAVSGSLHDEAPADDAPVAAATAGDDAAGSVDDDGDEAAVAQRALRRLQPHLQHAADELLAPARLLGIVEPALGRLAQSLVHELHAELAATLRLLARQAVEEELARRRGR